MTKKTVLKLFAIMCALLVFTSCSALTDGIELMLSGKNRHSTPAENSQDVVESETESPETLSDESETGKFDIEVVRKKLSLNGKPFSLPCTAEDLGDEYYYLDDLAFKVFAEQPDPSYYVATLVSKNTGEDYSGQIGISLKDMSEGDELKKQTIWGINLYRGNDQVDFSVDGISMKSSREEVLSKFGKPSKETPEGDVYQYTDPNNENNLLRVMFDDNTGEIFYFVFNYGAVE